MLTAGGPARCSSLASARAAFADCRARVLVLDGLTPPPLPAPSCPSLSLCSPPLARLLSSLLLPRPVGGSSAWRGRPTAPRRSAWKLCRLPAPSRPSSPPPPPPPPPSPPPLSPYSLHHIPVLRRPHRRTRGGQHAGAAKAETASNTKGGSRKDPCSPRSIESHFAQDQPRIESERRFGNSARCNATSRAHSSGRTCTCMTFTAFESNSRSK